MCGSTATTAGMGTHTTGKLAGGNARLVPAPVGNSIAGFTVRVVMFLLKDTGVRTPIKSGSPPSSYLLAPGHSHGLFRGDRSALSTWVAQGGQAAALEWGHFGS